MYQGRVKKGWTENWFRTPNSIYEVDFISGYAKAAYIFLCRCADAEGQSFPGYNAIAKAIGFGRTRTIEAIKELEAVNLLIKENRRNDETGEYYSNLYTVIHPDDVLPPSGMSSGDTPLSPYDRPMSSGDTPLSPYDRPMSPREREVRSTYKDSPKKTYSSTLTQNSQASPINSHNSREQVTDQKQVCEKLRKSLLEKGVKVQSKTLTQWLENADPEDILEAAELATRKDVRSPAGYIGTILRNGIIRVKNTSKELNTTHDARYDSFYKLFPD